MVRAAPSPIHGVASMAWSDERTQVAALQRAAGAAPTGQEVIGAAFDRQMWTLELRQRRGERAGAASALRARVLVNCGGLYADAVDATLRAGRPTFAVAPRRGDYVILDARGPLASLGALARRVGGASSAVGRGAYAWRTVHGDR